MEDQVGGCLPQIRQNRLKCDSIPVNVRYNGDAHDNARVLLTQNTVPAVCRLPGPLPILKSGEDENMARLSMKVMAIVPALLWGGCMLFVGLINMGAPSYGGDFLRMMSSVYPGFHDTRTAAEVVIGTIYGLVDGAIAGVLFAWLYNLIAGSSSHATQGAMH